MLKMYYRQCRSGQGSVNFGNCASHKNIQLMSKKNYLQVWNMINTIKNLIKKLRNEVHILFLFKKYQQFSNNVNSYFLNDPFIEIEEDFPDKRV
jgi:uncharacterized protein YlzI (FlbEa/FlbD family)